MEKAYLQSVIKQFEYYKSAGEKAMIQLKGQDLFWQYNEETNSIAIIVNHMWGNMKSRWTNFLETDGEKDWRNRDQEFEEVIKTRAELMEKWNDGWNCLFKALNTVNEENFNTEVFIRNQAHSIMDAINRQLAHYSYHIGQIISLAKMRKGSEWTSLTIPKGKSKEFNQVKFSKGKHSGHFSDDLK